MTGLPGPALDFVEEALVDVRDMLIKLFAIDESEANARVTHEVERLKVAWNKPDWLLDHDTAALFSHDGAFQIANGIYWNGDWSACAAHELQPAAWPLGSELDEVVAPSGELPADNAEAVRDMMIRLFRIDRSEAEGRIFEYLETRRVFPLEYESKRNRSFTWANDVFWAHGSYDGPAPGRLVARPWPNALPTRLEQLLDHLYVGMDESAQRKLQFLERNAWLFPSQAMSMLRTRWLSGEREDHRQIALLPWHSDSFGADGDTERSYFEQLLTSDGDKAVAQQRLSEFARLDRLAGWRTESAPADASLRAVLEDLFAEMHREVSIDQRTSFLTGFYFAAGGLDELPSILCTWLEGDRHDLVDVALGAFWIANEGDDGVDKLGRLLEQPEFRARAQELIDRFS